MNNEENNRSGMEVPFDDEVTFNEEAVVVRVASSRKEKDWLRVKSCSICTFPIHVRVVSYPCHHYFCYECHQKNTFNCGYCGSLNTQALRLPDYALILTCDPCSKYFSIEEELEEHLKNH